MSEEKKGIEFGKEWIGELPLQKQMREDEERLRGELQPDDGYVPKGETIEIPVVKYVYSDNINIDRGANSVQRELERKIFNEDGSVTEGEGNMKKTYFPALGKLVEIPAKKIPNAIPPWEEIPSEITSDDMSDEDTVQVGLGVPAFIEQLLSDGNLVDRRDVVKVTSVVQTPEDAAQGYSWKLNLDIKNGVVVGSKYAPAEGEQPKPGDTIMDTNGTTYVVPAENIGDGWGAELPPEQQTPEVQGGIPEDKLREVTVPFPATSIREYFQDKSLFFIANYSESKLKGQSFLTYLANINIPSDVKFNTPISYEEYAEVMKAYMESINVINCAGLHVMAAEMLLVAKGLPYERSPYALPIDDQIVLKFIQEYKYLVDNWVHFIDSTQVFALRSIKALNEHFKPEDRFPVVEDRSYVGANIAQLYRIPEFIAVYFSIENAKYKLSYFRDQYEEYMFKNETLAKYFQSPNNFAALYYMHFASGLFEAKDVNHGLFRIGVFDETSEYYEATPYALSIQE